MTLQGVFGHARKSYDWKRNSGSTSAACTGNHPDDTRDKNTTERRLFRDRNPSYGINTPE